jgi:hypothetical protein
VSLWIASPAPQPLAQPNEEDAEAALQGVMAADEVIDGLLDFVAHSAAGAASKQSSTSLSEGPPSFQFAPSPGESVDTYQDRWLLGRSIDGSNPKECALLSSMSSRLSCTSRMRSSLHACAQFANLVLTTVAS